jgi:glycosyltransferase involved in cell wall biosynthesis
MFAGFAANIHHRWHTFTGQVWINKKGFSRIVLKTADLIIARLASRVFTDSASQSRFLLDEGVTRSGQITILGPGSIAGVDINRFRPDTANRVRIRDQMCVDTDACVFLFVGRINKDKGIFDLIQAFQRLATRLRGIELWVVGPDEEGLTQTLQQLAQECSAPIRWLGATSAPEEFMMAADILLLPSYREGFGSVVIEGAACGIPTVAYRINGVIDAVADGSTGILVEPGETSAFESAMRQLALDKELRLSLGNKARERAVRDFNSEQVTKAWLDFYRCHLHQSNEAA